MPCPSVARSAPKTSLDVISPELVLVCPELRALALALLPERDPEGFLPAPWTRPAEISEQQAEEVACELSQPDETTDVPFVPVPEPEQPRQPSGPPAEPIDRGSKPSLLVAALAYTAQQSVVVALHLTGVTAALVGVLYVAHLIRF